MSFDVAKINFLKFSTLELDPAEFSNAEILVTPSTKSATSSPNSCLIVSYVAKAVSYTHLTLPTKA